MIKNNLRTENVSIIFYEFLIRRYQNQYTCSETKMIKDDLIVKFHR